MGLLIEHSGCKEVGKIGLEERKMDSRRIGFIIRRKIRTTSGRRKLGVAWLVLDPVLLSLLYLFVFTVVRSNPDPRVLFIGISMFRVFQNSFKSGTASVSDFTGGINAERIRTNVIKFAMIRYRIIDSFIQGSGVAIVLIFMDVKLTGVIVFVVACLVMGVLAEGVALNVSLMIKRVPDLNNIVNNYFLLLMFFGSPAFYSMTLTEGIHHLINEFNPFAYFVEGTMYACGTVSEFWNLSFQLAGVVSIITILASVRGYSTLEKQRWEASSWS